MPNLLGNIYVTIKDLGEYLEQKIIINIPIHEPIQYTIH